MHTETRPRSATIPLQKVKTVHDLTPRQQEVLSLLAAGKSNLEIAETLCVAPGTVKAHIFRLMNMLEKRTRTELAVLWTETVHKGTGPDAA